MSQDFIRTLVWFILALIAQVALFAPLNLGPYINVFPYLIFILLISDQLSRLSIMLISTLMGFCIDLFSSDIIGPHMLACATIGYLRPYIIHVLFSEEVKKTVPTVKSPFNEYLIYTTSLVVIHHIICFSTEVFDINQWFFIFLKVIASAIVNIILISLIETIIVKK